MARTLKVEVEGDTPSHPVLAVLRAAGAAKLTARFPMPHSSHPCREIEGDTPSYPHPHYGSGSAGRSPLTRSFSFNSASDLVPKLRMLSISSSPLASFSSTSPTVVIPVRLRQL